MNASQQTLGCSYPDCICQGDEITYCQNRTPEQVHLGHKTALVEESYHQGKPTNMAPEEKARELWWKYYNRIEHTLSEEYSPEETEIAKGLALIAVDEIIGLDVFDCNCEWSDEDGDTREYWQEVKVQISNL